MFKHIVVGVDGSDRSRDALALAALLRTETGVITLAHVFCPDSVAWREGSKVPEATRRERAMRLLEEAQHAGDIRVDLRLHDSVDPGRGLHELAEELGADVIVTGSSRRSLLGHVMTGDDTRRTLDGAPCAVAVAPAGYGQQPRHLERIGVGYNASDESEQALALARELARRHQATLAVCEVVFLPAQLWVGLMSPNRVTVDQVVEETRRRLSEIEGVEAHATAGEMAQELSRFSAEVDLLIIGSRSYGPWGRILYGSTARRLTREARCPLLVLTRGARDRQRHEAILLEDATPV